MRAITDNNAWARAAFWCAFIGVSLALVTFLPTLVDYLALERGRVKRALTPVLVLQGAGILAFIASVVFRLHGGAQSQPFAFAFADAGVTALAISALISGDGYRPVGLRLRPQRPHHGHHA